MLEDRELLKRVVLVANQKGGVGKSTIVANVAGDVAAAGRRVLVVDGDQQGNVSTVDLGVKGDNGRGLAKTLQYGDRLEPVRAARPHLDVIPGGRDLGPVGMMAAASAGHVDLAANLGSALGALCAQERYDLVLIDSGPGDVPLLDALLRTARYLVVPATVDQASLDGVQFLADRYLYARRAGAAVELLGAVLFNVNPRATARNAAVIEQVTAMLEGASAPFSAMIRSAQASSVDQRNHHLTASELVVESETQKKSRLSQLREGVKIRREQSLWSRDSTALAEDFRQLTREILTRLAAKETQSTEAEAS